MPNSLRHFKMHAQQCHSTEVVIYHIVPNLAALKLCHWVNKIRIDSPTQLHKYHQ